MIMNGYCSVHGCVIHKYLMETKRPKRYMMIAFIISNRGHRLSVIDRYPLSDYDIFCYNITRIWLYNRLVIGRLLVSNGHQLPIVVQPPRHRLKK